MPDRSNEGMPPNPAPVDSAPYPLASEPLPQPAQAEGSWEPDAAPGYPAGRGAPVSLRIWASGRQWYCIAHLAVVTTAYLLFILVNGFGATGRPSDLVEWVGLVYWLASLYTDLRRYTQYPYFVLDSVGLGIRFRRAPRAIPWDALAAVELSQDFDAARAPQPEPGEVILEKLLPGVFPEHTGPRESVAWLTLHTVDGPIRLDLSDYSSRSRRKLLQRIVTAADLVPDSLETGVFVSPAMLTGPENVETCQAGSPEEDRL